MLKPTLIIVLALLLAPSLAIGENSTVGGEFELLSHANERYSSKQSHGKVVVLFFGFTHCPDVCPNTLGAVQTVLAQLGERSKLVQPVFISVDPKRDTPEILNHYLKYFDNNFIGLTGTTEEVDKVVEQFQGFYSYEGNVANGQYTVDHTSNLYIIDPHGDVANIIPYGLPHKVITQAIEKLIDEIET